MAVNNNWEFFKHKTKEIFESKSGKEIHAQRKTDIENSYRSNEGCIWYANRRVRDRQTVHNDIGIMRMSMDLIKLAIEPIRKTKAFHHSSAQNKNHSETIRNLIEFTVIFYLAGYFPAPINTI